MSVVVVKGWVAYGMMRKINIADKKNHNKSKKERSAIIKLQNDLTKFTDRLPSRCFIPDEKRLLFLVYILVTLILVERRGATFLISEKSTSM